MHGVIIRTVVDSDRDQIIGIFNYYVAAGFAAYPDTPVPPGFFNLFREGAIAFLVAEIDGHVVGFCVVKPFLPFSTFSRTATVSTFIAPAGRHRGIGTTLLEAVTGEAERKGVRVLLANISSRNPESLGFHGHHGFTECGRFHNAGLKFGELFDVVWMEKEIGNVPLSGQNMTKNR